MGVEIDVSVLILVLYESVRLSKVYGDTKTVVHCMDRHRHAGTSDSIKLI